MILAGDIGGTKTRLALFDREHGPRHPLVEVTYPSADYPDLQAVVAEFLAGKPAPTGAALAVAGPVADGRADPTNLPWDDVDGAALAQGLGLGSVILLNDLEAVAFGVTAIAPADLVTIAAGRPVPHAPIAVIAPGTGLGQAFATWDGDRYRSHPSEGGHVDFAPTDELEVELLRYLMARRGHVSYEAVCSGVGVPNLYEFLGARGGDDEPPEVMAQLAAAADRTRAIVALGMDPAHPSARCQDTVELFIRILGSEAGNLALKVMARGGIYLAGGLAHAVMPQLGAGPFVERIRAKGRLSPVLTDVPVHVLPSEVGLAGAALAGLQAEA